MSSATYQQEYSIQYETTSRVSLWSRFISWCNKQQEQRLVWLAISVAAHGCVLTPLTLMAVVFTGNLFFLFALASVAMALSLIVNLAAMPTKITIPTFFLSIIIDLGIVISCLAISLR